MQNTHILDSNITNELNLVIEKIKTRIPVKQIILFGSHASGTCNSNSDIDLCIITEDSRRKIEILWDIQEEIYHTSKHTFDIVVSRTDEFADRADSVASLEKEISQQGIILYG